MQDTKHSTLITKKEDNQEKKEKQEQIYKSDKKFEELFCDSSLPEKKQIVENILKGIYARGWVSPSKIQADTLPIILADEKKNMIAQAHNGSGKTATFVISMLYSVDCTKKEPQALCIAHSRELALQIVSETQKLAKYLPDLKVFAAVPESSREKITAQIIVGTPGSLIAKIRGSELLVDKIKMLILDEADEMLSKQGLAEQAMQIRKRVFEQKEKEKETTVSKKQVLLFSATFPPTTKKFADNYCPHAHYSLVQKKENLKLETIKQFVIETKEGREKYESMKTLFALLTMSKSIIFTQTIQTAKNLFSALMKDGYSVSLLHGGDMTPSQRDKTMEDFRTSKTTVLITSNVLARGIDDPSINVVVNYDVPTTQHGKGDGETYLHRIARSGRFGRLGVSLTFICNEKEKEALQQIQNLWKCEITPLSLSDKKIEDTEKIIQSFLSHHY